MNISIDTMIWIVAAVVLSLSLFTPFLNPFFRFRKMLKGGALDETPASVPISVIITVSNKQAQALANHLPQWLAQDYPPGFEVIVVAEKADSDAEDVVLRYLPDHDNLYATYLPPSSRYMSRQKLAVTLGVKAAKNEWIVLTDASCSPASGQWLSSIGNSGEVQGASLVFGYCNYDDDARTFYRFDRLQTACYLLRKAAHGTAYRANGSTFAFRKSEFIAADGYRGNLEHARGEHDFLVNKLARSNESTVVLAPEAWTIEDIPLRKEWQSAHIYYMHTRRHLHRSASMRWLYNTDQLALHLTLLLQLCCIVTGIGSLLLLGIGLASMIMTLIMRSVIAKPVLKFFKTNIPVWQVYFLELSVVWHQLIHYIRYARASNLDFTTHKV